MKEIASQNNKSVKLIKKLKDRKHRDAEGMYIIEGPNILEDAVRNDEDIILVGINSYMKKDEQTLPDAVLDKTINFSQDIFKTFTDTVTPQNVIAVVRKKVKKPVDDAGRYVILDELQDPGNVGTIIRTAEAAGFSGIITVKGTADIYSPKVVRAAAGSLFRISIIEMDNKELTLKYLNDKNINLYACDANGETIYTDVDLKSNIGIVVGNEGNGISHFFLKNCRTVRIPMKEETESLNAAVAAGIVIYESVRQKRIQE